jgi:hypothetical protein
MGRKRPRRSRRASPPPPPPPPKLLPPPPPAWWRRLSPLPTLLAVLLAGVLVAQRLPMIGDPTLALDVHSEALRLVLDREVDLVDRSSEADRPAASGIRLASPWIYLRQVEVTPPDDTAHTVSQDRSLSASLLTSLTISKDCAVYVVTRPDGFVHMAIQPLQKPDSTKRADGAPAAEAPGCRLNGTVWSDSTLNPSDSLLLVEPLEGMPSPAFLKISATPGVVTPAVLEFHPAEPVRVSRLHVSRLTFETRERGQYPVSSIEKATVAYPGLPTDTQLVYEDDTLGFTRLRGEIRELTIDTTLHTGFTGKGVPHGVALRRPTLLDQLKSSTTLIALGTVLTSLAAVAEVMKRRK